MANSLDIRILTPDKQFFVGNIKQIVTEGEDGRFEVMGGHIPLVVLLKPTVTEFIDLDGKKYTAFTSSGVLRVIDNKVRMLCNACEWSSDIDTERAEKAKLRAEERLKKQENIDAARAKAALIRAVERLKAAK